MASLRLQPPASFNFQQPDEWPRWKSRFEQFRAASGLSGEAEERQVSTLLYCLGENAEDVLNSTTISQTDRKKYDKVLEQFDTFFKVRRNVIFERARFNMRKQQPAESAEEYITTLYRLAETCEFGDLKEELIRDRVVVGIRDTVLSQRLQMEPDLTLEKAKKSIRQRDAVREQQGILHKTDTPQQSLDAMSKRKPHQTSQWKQGGKPSHYRTNSNPQKTSDSKKCSRCGKGPHPRSTCPAKDVTCHRCQKKGHYSSQCFSKRVAEVAIQQEGDRYQQEEDLDTVYLNIIGSGNPTSKSWNTPIKVNKCIISFKLDTGAEVTAMTEQAFNQLKGVTLRKPTKTICGADRKPLKVLGQINVTLSAKGQSCNQAVYIVRNLSQNLLGLPAIQSLNLLAQVEEVTGQLGDVPNQFPKLFTGLGTLQGDFHIHLQPDATPFALHTPRNVPLPLRQKVKKELERMESMGVISKVDVPTPWCAGMVVVPKKDGSVRICVDLKPLNTAVLREVHPLPRVDDTLAQLTGAKVFSKLDANSGFWQIPVAEDSRLLTTFITPFGRFCFNKMPFGISSAPEHFQRRMNAILDGLPGVLCLMDDIIVYGSDNNDHNTRLHATLQRLQTAGVTLNKAKCQFGKDTITFLGHVISSKGISADPTKVAAIVNMPTPSNVTELRRFMGMVNQLGKFTSDIAELSKPLRELLSKKSTWLWGPSQVSAFQKLKTALTTPTVLAWYNPAADTKLSADASAYGLGAVLLQKSIDGEWKPVAYASRSMTETEMRYAQIEKEALAITWACERFSDYILGKNITIETDHKPLVPLLSTKHLDSIPPRVLRFRLRLMRFSYNILHVPGKLLYTADTLSRAPQSHSEEDKRKSYNIEFNLSAILQQLPANAETLEKYLQAQKEDPICMQLSKFCIDGWPEQHNVKGQLKCYWQARRDLTQCEGILLYRTRVVVPERLQQETLDKIHKGHQGIHRCRLRVSESVWWPGVNKQMEEYVKKCPTCMKLSPPVREPMLTSPLPDHPWEKVGTDLFELNGQHYLIMVDYYSRFPEVIKMTSTTSTSVITAMKSIFSRHGIPRILISDNGPQYSSMEMQLFAEKYGFKHITSSPYYPQSNGLAERTVKTVKQLLQETDDMYLTLLSYRTTPLPWCSLSPCELLMGRRLRTDLPQTKKQLKPNWTYLKGFADMDRKYKQQQKENYDKRHRVRSVSPLPDDAPVWVNTQGQQVPGRIITTASTPRSYVVNVPSGQVRRNRTALTDRHEQATSDSNANNNPTEP
jgi:transposase InsO family protein